MRKQALWKTASSWALYQLGDLFSKLMKLPSLGFLYLVYNRLMGWSGDLDPEFVVWNRPKPEKDKDSP